MKILDSIEMQQVQGGKGYAEAPHSEQGRLVVAHSEQGREEIRPFRP